MIQSAGNERYFSFGVGMVYFVAVSTDESIDETSTQGAWFKASILYTSTFTNLYWRCIYNPTWLIILSDNNSPLQSVLENANQNRDKWPWLVVYQHRPIYNSNK